MSLIWGGSCQKNMAAKGRPGKKILGVKGGCFKFCSDSGICDNRELKQRKRERHRKRHPKKWIRAASNFTALIATPLIRQMLVFLFQELNSIKNVSTFTKRKRNLSFSVFSFFVLFCLFVFFLEGGGGVISIILGKKGGTLKIFCRILQELFFKSHQPHYPIKNERSLNLKSWIDRTTFEVWEPVSPRPLIRAGVFP